MPERPASRAIEDRNVFEFVGTFAAHNRSGYGVGRQRQIVGILGRRTISRLVMARLRGQFVEDLNDASRFHGSGFHSFVARRAVLASNLTAMSLAEERTAPRFVVGKQEDCPDDAAVRAGSERSDWQFRVDSVRLARPRSVRPVRHTQNTKWYG